MPAIWIRLPRRSTVRDSSRSSVAGSPSSSAGPGERVARDCDVVVSEHGEGVEALQRLVELRAAAWTRQEISCGDDEIGPALAHPGRRLPHGDAAARRRPEVEVGEVRDPQPVELGRQPVDRHVENAHAHPAGLEPAVGEQPPRHIDGERRQDREKVQARRPPGSPSPKPPLHS